ncbi:uncharacterized protein PGTG_02518 [Puccinia graminis f. sp. tritici CRL 75-36-700-3]|uniref:Uncharacterized protein n=1 Tax=Puccinia graminis f. sp. tritici (strain CRL 75-36-700-3 / race SCCL) TaxID=418459 RepID=E3JVK2_PUCGT|nr:uncharacterized protein PGTG_02518 [Puccinia graminis f. sp. tritici CRL 75-36-700-3]EFP76077.2 hypothetical protein PGTG_02518 [Puccinia graminis f. sp. tritici CRL 75-36-700-3]
MPEQSFTAFDLHSLNKILASFELQREWKELSRVNSLKAIGYPFDQSLQQPIQQPTPVLKKQPSRISTVLSFFGSPSAPPSARSVSEAESQLGSNLRERQAVRDRAKGDVDQLPLFRLMIQRVWGAFPGLIDLPIETWLGIERFILDFNSRNFSTSRERRQFTKRAVISIGFTKLLSSYITSIISFQNQLSLPTRPSQEDLDLVSQLPQLISTFGSRIKFVERKNDEFLVLYRKKTGRPKLPIDSSAGENLSLNVGISVIGWSALCDLLKTIDPSTGHHDRQTSISLLRRVFHIQSSQAEKLYQVLEAAHPNPSSPDDEIKNELDKFLADERGFQTDWISTGKRVSEAKEGYKNFLTKIVHHDGEIDKMYKLITEHERLETVLALDPMYEQAQTWTIMWIAYMLHFVFITGPDGDEVCELFIKIDKLVPYELIKQGLKIINPTLAIRTTVALILGQPFGSLSLFQRILDSIVRHEIRCYDKKIETVVQSSYPPVTHPSELSRMKSLAAIKKFVYLPEEEKRKTRAEFDQSDEDMIILILRWSKDFDEVELQSVQESEKIFNNSSGSLADANLFHDLIILLRLVSLKRDREQIIEMITEPNNPIIRTIKQILEIYYPTIYKVALASDLSKKFGQTEAFLKDLVQLLVRRKEEEVSVDKLVKLLDQHKQSYWSFLNDLVRCENLCDPMKEWIQSCFDLVKSGLNESEAASGSGRFGIELEELRSAAPIEALIAESRSLSTYNRLIKMIDNIQYRLVLCSSPFTLETHFSSQAFHILTELDQLPFARHLDQSARDARPPLPFGWAWWIDEQKVCGKGGDRVNDDGAEVQGSPIKDDQPLGPSRLVVNSDLHELKKRASVYLELLMKSVHLFDRPTP